MVKLQSLRGITAATRGIRVRGTVSDRYTAGSLTSTA